MLIPFNQLLINGILQIWNLGWALLASAYCDKIGRRKLFMASGIGMAVFFTMQTVCSAVFQVHGSSGAAHAVIAFIFLFYAAYEYVSSHLILASQTKSPSTSIAFTPLIVSYTIEILPYQLRAKGFTVFNFALSLSLIFNQYVNPIALGTSSAYFSLPDVNAWLNTDAIKWKYYVGFLVSVLTPEVHLLQVVYCCWLVCEVVFLWFCESSFTHLSKRV